MALRAFLALGLALLARAETASREQGSCTSEEFCDETQHVSLLQSELRVSRSIDAGASKVSQLGEVPSGVDADIIAVAKPGSKSKPKSKPGQVPILDDAAKQQQQTNAEAAGKEQQQAAAEVAAKQQQQTTAEAAAKEQQKSAAEGAAKQQQQHATVEAAANSAKEKQRAAAEVAATKQQQQTTAEAAAKEQQKGAAEGAAKQQQQQHAAVEAAANSAKEQQRAAAKTDAKQQQQAAAEGAKQQQQAAAEGATKQQQQATAEAAAATTPKVTPAAAGNSSAIFPSVTVSVAMKWLGVSLGLLAVATMLHFCQPASSPWRKYLAEFLGTFILIFGVGCNVLQGDATWGVTSIACTLMVLIYALAGVSGANFNPAVSVSLCISGKLPVIDMAIYICVQLAGGILAGLSYGLLLGKTFTLAPKGDYTWAQAGIAECLYTFMLTFVVLNTAASKAHAGKDQFYGLAIGFCVVAGGYGAGSISGGCFNPAIALGIDSSGSAAGFGGSLVYSAFEFLGCALAALFFRVCRPSDFGGSDGPSLPEKLVSEFLGTYMLVLTVGLNVLSESKAGVFSIAAALMSMIFALGSVSGAHFNPAVTMAIAFAGRGLVSVSEAVLYISVQVLGGICAAFTYAWLMNGKTVPLGPTQSLQQALAGELAFTFLLGFVVLSVATVSNPLSQYFGLAIGMCVTAGGYAIGSLSGGSLNPAVSAGLALSDYAMNSGTLRYLLPYAGVELLGGIVAAAMFRIIHEAEYVKDEGL